MRNRAVILKKIPLREHDELIVCYTREMGKQRFLAKSSLLKTSLQGAHLDVMNMAEFNIIEGKYYGIIASASSVNSFPNIKKSLERLAAAFFVLECFDKLVYSGEHDEKLWDFLAKTLDFCDKTENLPDDINEKIRHELIETLGYDRSTKLMDLTNSYFSSVQFMSNI